MKPIKPNAVVPIAALLDLFGEGERLTIAQLYMRDRSRTKNSVKAAVKTLVSRGALKVVGDTPIDRNRPATLYARTGNDGAAPDRFAGTRLAAVLALFKPGQALDVQTVRQRMPDMTAPQASRAVFDLCKRGRLVQAGWRDDKQGLLYRLPDGAEPVVLRKDRPEVEADVPPFVALFTPPLPAFRIKSTRRVLNLTGRDDDDEREAA